MTEGPRVFTVGHSTRSQAELLDLLRGFGIHRLVDVRRYPVSRRHPHFGRELLGSALEAMSIEYVHEPDLGGRREPVPGSSNTALRSAAFRGYADHMASAEFQTALGRVVSAACRQAALGRQALMCAEAVPWRCHRQLIADALVARGIVVEHVLGPGRSSAHVQRAEARVTPEGLLVYEARGQSGALFTPPIDRDR